MVNLVEILKYKFFFKNTDTFDLKEFHLFDLEWLKFFKQFKRNRFRWKFYQVLKCILILKLQILYNVQWNFIKKL